MTKNKFNAVIFDLDGVITQTATIHSRAWKETFEDYLKKREKDYGEKFKEFTHENDYLPYIDGKPRYKGVESFLNSRGIKIPLGELPDKPEEETVYSLGNKKNETFHQLISEGNIPIFKSTIEFIKNLKLEGIKIGVASSSKNCKAILEATNLLRLFETRVDGLVSLELNLNGKPEPDIFTTASDNLNVSYDETVIVEDAVSGVQAGRRGNFGLVIGIARENNSHELEINGADIVVSDLSELSIRDLNYWFTEGLKTDSWHLKYYGYPETHTEEAKREVLCTIGNGYLGTRGAMEEFEENGLSYPGTYIAGVYNKLDSIIEGKTIQNEDLVNCPNWLPITFRINKKDWFNLDEYKIDHIERKIDLKYGLLQKTMLVSLDDKRKILIESNRIVSMENPHLVSLQYKIMPINFSSSFEIKSSLDGSIENKGVSRYEQLNSKHFNKVEMKEDQNLSSISVMTSNSKIQIFNTSKLILKYKNKPIDPKIIKNIKENEKISSLFTVGIENNKELVIEKIVYINSSKNQKKDVTEIFELGKSILDKYNSFDEIKEESTKKWSRIWEQVDIELEGDRLVQKLLRLHIYHMIVTASPHNKDIDAGIPARGLHGEAYRGHIFWDTLFVFQFYSLYFPETAKSALMYRYRRLNQAKKLAVEHGFEGAMFPWQSSLTGEEETQQLHLNPISGNWNLDHSPLQRHVSIAIAFNLWNYFWITRDSKFLKNTGAELYFEICKFWASLCKINSSGTYDIEGVMGPDEFHELDPKTKSPGLKNNFYTNIMVSWLFNNVNNIKNILDPKIFEQLCKKLNLDKKDFHRWNEIKDKISIRILKEGIFEQFEGYFELKDLDWDEYRKKYKNIHRMDRILKAEGKSPDNYKVSKQADTLMPFYLLPDKKLTELKGNLVNLLPKDYLKKNFDYYNERTSHGSTLSRLVHSKLLNLLGDHQGGFKLFLEALKSDYADVQGGTTGEGIHTGVMGGTILQFIINYIGIDLNAEILTMKPNLLSKWRKIRFKIPFNNNNYKITIKRDKIEVKTSEKKTKIIKIKINDKYYDLNPENDYKQEIMLN